MTTLRFAAQIGLTCYLMGFMTPVYAQGVREWTRTTPGNSEWGENLVVDHAGDIIVVGSAGSGCLVVKYHPDGTTVWQRVVRGGPGLVGGIASQLAIDASDNLYMSGVVLYGTGQYLLNAKLAPDGATGWSRVYPNPQGLTDSGNYYALPLAVAVGNDGSMVVGGFLLTSGQSMMLVRYSSDGSELWHRTGGPLSGADLLAIDANDDIYAAGFRPGSTASVAEPAVAVFSPAGSLVWDHGYRAAAAGYAGAFTKDASGDIYLAAGEPAAGGGFEYNVIKVDGAGERLWERSYHSGTAGVDIPTGMTVDTNGNVAVTGLSQTSSTPGSAVGIVTLEYTPDGVMRWHSRQPITGITIGSHGLSESSGLPTVATDAAGNVIIGGNTMGTGSSFSALAIKYSQAAKQLWERRYSAGQAGTNTYTQASAADASGNVYQTGSYWNYSGPEPVHGAFTLKYSP